MSVQEVYRAIMQHHDWLAGAGYPVQRRANGRLDPWAGALNKNKLNSPLPVLPRMTDKQYHLMAPLAKLYNSYLTHKQINDDQYTKFWKKHREINTQVRPTPLGGPPPPIAAPNRTNDRRKNTQSRRLQELAWMLGVGGLGVAGLAALAKRSRRKERTRA